MINIPKMKVGIVAVSRDCFPESLSVNRRKALVDAYAKKYDAEDIYECPICIVESEIHMVQALEDIKKAGCNALCVYLGNFGPEISETLLAKHFEGPKMFVAASEENTQTLASSRGDAYCGMLNASYNLKLRNIKAYIPEYPVGTAEECADMIHEFLPIARAIDGLNNLKIIISLLKPWAVCNPPPPKPSPTTPGTYVQRQGRIGAEARKAPVASPRLAQTAPSWGGSLKARQVWARLAHGRTSPTPGTLSDRASEQS